MKFKYQIIVTKNNKQIEFIGSYKKESSANAKFLQLKKQSDNVIFPIKFNNIGRKIQEAQYELVLIKLKDEHESSTTLIRNQYGEFVPHETNNDSWIVYDKIPYYKEESFWVYGYHPLVQRKDFLFIFHEKIQPYGKTKDKILNIMIYKNKLLIEQTHKLDLIICKNHNDCIRLYNTIQEYANKFKIKYILFNGDWNTSPTKRQIIVEKIKELTHWNDLKIKRSSTRP